MHTTNTKLTEVHGEGDVKRLQTRTAIRAPIDTVWEALTSIDHVRQWWSDGHIGTKPGDRIQLASPEDVDGTILIMMKPHVFAFTWHDEPHRSSHPQWIESATNSLVHFDLVQNAPEATLLTLIQFAPSVSALGAAAGWHHLFELLTSYLETGVVVTGDQRFEQLKALYGA